MGGRSRAVTSWLIGIDSSPLRTNCVSVGSTCGPAPARSMRANAVCQISVGHASEALVVVVSMAAFAEVDLRECIETHCVQASMSKPISTP